MHIIGALKTNRILYPQGIWVQSKKFVAYAQTADTNFVTIGQETYHTYRYEGALNDLSNNVVLLCWSADDKALYPKRMRCFLSTEWS